MLTLLFTMFSNYCSLGPWEPQGGDTREVAPKPPVLPTALSIKATHVSVRARNVARSFRRPRILWGLYLITANLREATALAGLIKANLRYGVALHQQLQTLHASLGEREPAARLPRNPTGGPLGLLKPAFPAKQIPSDFYEQA